MFVKDDEGRTYDPVGKVALYAILLCMLITCVASFILPVAKGSGAKWAQPPDSMTPNPDAESKLPELCASLGLAAPVGVLIVAGRKGWRR